MRALSGMQYHVSQSLGEVLLDVFIAVILSEVQYFRYLEMHDMLDPLISVHLVQQMYHN